MTRIKEYRLKNNLTLRDVSKWLGISESAVSLFENNFRQPKIEYLKKLSKLYNCKIDDLID